MERSVLNKKIAFPIVLFEVENHDQPHIVGIEMFNRIDHAESGIEHFEVNDDLYEAFDADGRLLRYYVDNQDKVHLICTEAIPTHSGRLVELLQHFLPIIKPEVDFSKCNLEHLLEYVREWFLYIPSRPLRKILWGWLKQLFGRSKE